jgi:hypothetical protein
VAHAIAQPDLSSPTNNAAHARTGQTLPVGIVDALAAKRCLQRRALNIRGFRQMSAIVMSPKQ